MIYHYTVSHYLTYTSHLGRATALVFRQQSSYMDIIVIQGLCSLVPSVEIEPTELLIYSRAYNQLDHLTPRYKGGVPTADRSPLWLRPRDDGGGLPVWVWSLGQWRCIYRECGCRTVGVVAAAEEAGVTAELLPPWFGDGRVGSAVHVVNW